MGEQGTRHITAKWPHRSLRTRRRPLEGRWLVGMGSTGLSALKMIWAKHTALQHEHTVGKTLPLRQIVRDNEHRASLIDEFTGESMDE